MSAALLGPKVPSIHRRTAQTESSKQRGLFVEREDEVDLIGRDRQSAMDSCLAHDLTYLDLR
jgi:hypothetical protein